MPTKRLTVLQVLPDLNSGGVERGVLEVGAELVRQGHRSLVMSAGGRLVDELQQQGSEHFTWPIGTKSLFTLRLIGSLRRLLIENRVDILHMRSRVPAWIAYLAWKGMKVGERPGLVSTVHGLHSVSRYSAVMTKGERVIAVSDTVKKYIQENYPETDTDVIRLIYRGVDPAEFPLGYEPSKQWLDEWKAAFPSLQGKRVVVLPGRLTRLKGHHDFLRVIQLLKQRGRPVIGLIVGGEDPKRQAYAKELYQAVKQLDLEKDILFTGHRSDIREIYTQCDAVVSLSTKPESFGRTVLEALSLGLPVVGYNHGGVGEILSNLYPLGRVPLGDTKAVAKTLEGIFEHSPATVKPNTMYLRETMLQQTLDVYQELAQR